MSNRVVGGLTVAGLVLVGWTLVGQDSSNFRASPSAVAGRYVVSGSIMCDSMTGQTWTFVPQVEGLPESVWLPVKRLDTAEAVKQWKQQIQDGVNNRIKNQRNYDYNGKPYNQQQFDTPPVFKPLP